MNFYAVHSEAPFNARRRHCTLSHVLRCARYGRRHQHRLYCLCATILLFVAHKGKVCLVYSCKRVFCAILTCLCGRSLRLGRLNWQETHPRVVKHSGWVFCCLLDKPLVFGAKQLFPMLVEVGTAHIGQFFVRYR